MIIFDSIFFIDIIISALTKYYDKNYLLVESPTLILKHYLKSKFLIDFLSVFPWYLISFRLLIIKIVRLRDVVNFIAI